MAFDPDPASLQSKTDNQSVYVRGFDIKPAPWVAVQFTGSAREYFRIWIVNLCLSLLTFGIFSAWAKVRKKRYFYSHTIIDGTPLQYLGRPIPILKGRIIAAAAFFAYYISSYFFIASLPYFLIAGTLLAPWVIIRSAAFNSRYSAYRNMTFRFDGRYLDSVKELYLWALIPAVMIALSFEGLAKNSITGAVAGGTFVIIALLFPWMIKRFKGFIVSHTSFGNWSGVFSASGGQFFGIYFMAGLIMIVMGIVTGLILFSSVRFLKSEVMAVIGIITMYAGYVLAYAYVKAREGNLVWDHTRLGPLHFRSTLPVRGLAKLYLTNALGIIASIGLLTPWAVMRTLKYRADNLQVLLQGELTDFHGSKHKDVRATGEELGDFFDMDLSL